MYKVILFEKNNRKPVEEFILSLNDETITKILWMVNLLEYNGLSTVSFLSRLASVFGKKLVIEFK